MSPPHLPSCRKAPLALQACRCCWAPHQVYKTPDDYNLFVRFGAAYKPLRADQKNTLKALVPDDYNVSTVKQILDALQSEASQGFYGNQHDGYKVIIHENHVFIEILGRYRCVLCLPTKIDQGLNRTLTAYEERALGKELAAPAARTDRTY